MSRKAGHRVDRIALFESQNIYVLVGHLRATERHRILVVRRKTPLTPQSTVRELNHDTHQDDLVATLKALEREYDGATLAHRLDAVAFLGMVRFLEGYHMLFITRREPVGVILGHTVFRVEETAMISVSEGPGPVAPTMASSAAGSSSAAAASAAAELPEASEADHLDDDASAARGQTTFGGLGRFLQSSLGGIFSRSQGGGRWDDGWAEKRYKSLFQSMDLTRDFYFSYTYDLTNTLQTNQLGSPDATAAASSPSSAKSTPAAATSAATPSPSGSPGPASSADGTPPQGPAVPPLRGKYVWNHHLMVHLLPELRDGAWLTPLVHGFFMQSTLSLCGRLIAITLIARRSRLFAGARLLKRGLCASGHTANEVETEQIVADSARGALHSSRISSAVQLRGSIPLVWGHGDLKVIVPRPDISIQTADPTYDATLRHFEGLWQEYGGPVLVFDLVRQVERRPRELLLGQALSAAVAELNRRLEREGHAHAGHLRHIPYDFKKESKRKGSDAFDAIERLAEHFLARTGFFCSAPTHPRAQSGTLPLPLSTAEAEAIRRLLGAVDDEHDGGGTGTAGTAAGTSPATTSASLLEQCASSGSTGSPRRWDASRALPATDSGRSSRAEAAPAHDDEEEAEEDEEEGEEEQQTWLALQQSDESGVTARSTRSLTRSWTRRPANWRAGVAPLSSSDATSVHTEQLSGGSTTWKQSGVVRTNCIDCLDRTNVAQFCIGRCLLKRQLFALGLAPASESIEAANTALMAMYEEQGTVLALQYAGSQALHATNSNAAKDFLQSAKRFYRNTFTDMEKQQIMDVFLGVFTPRRGHPNIWEIDSDLFLHNRPPPALHAPLRPRQPTLEPEEVEPPTRQQQRESQSRGTPARPHDLFDDYYPPTVLTSFDEVLSRPFAAPMKFRQTSQAAPKAPASHPPLDTSPAIAASVVGSGNQGDDAAGATLDPESTLLADVKLAAIGDLPVMLPSGYSQVDEWDRRRRTSLQTSRLAERYVSLYRQQADKQVYKRYVEIGRLEPVSTSSGGDANVPTAFTSV